MASALGQYRESRERTGWPDAVDALQVYLDGHPDSPWKPALELNLGIIYRQTGHFSKALEIWQDGWRDTQGLSDAQGVTIANNMAARLSELEAYLGREELLAPLLESLKGRSIAGSATERVSDSLLGLYQMQHHPEESFRCGPLALSRIADYRPQETPASVHAVLDGAPSTDKGLSLSMVEAIAERAGMHYQMAYRSAGAPIIIPAVTHWKVGHYAALVDEQNDRYLIQDATFGEDIRVSHQTLEEEASGYFLVPEGTLPAGWRAVTPEEADQVWGRGNTGMNFDSGATGSSSISLDASSPFNSSSAVDSSLTDATCDTCGMTGASAELSVVSLQLKDTPVGYRPPAGPPVRVRLVYSQRDMPQGAPVSSNFGPNWNFNWSSYVQDNVTSAAAATLYLRGGGTEPFTFSSTTATTSYPGPYSRAILTRNVNGGTVSFTLSFPDGSVEQFVEPGSANQYFLTALSDKVGNTVTLAYDSLTRISTITDAVGQVTTFSYVNKSSLLIKTVTDPFTRVATFTYCSGTSNCPLGMLASVTDVLGIKSTFRYGQTSANGYTNASFVNTLTTPYGTTQFQYGDVFTNSSLGTTRFLLTTDPLKRTSYVEFNQAQDAGDSSNGVIDAGLTPTGPGVLVCTQYLNSRNTFIFDANQFANAGGSAAQANGTLSYSQAHVIHWLHNPADANPTSTSRVMESEKQPLENRVWYSYYGQNGGCGNVPPTVGARFFPVTASGTVTNGANDQPTAVARIVLGADGQTNVTQVQNFVYNSNGNIVMSQDPVGRQLTYQYAANGIDLQTTTNTTVVNGVALDDLLEMRSNYTTNHLPQTITGANGYSSEYLYNGYGQVTQFTDAKQEVTKFIYGTGSAVQMAQLMTIQGPINVAKTTFTYDTVSRLASVTDSAGYKIQYTSYDNADRLLTTTYPDGTTSGRSYLDPVRGQVLLDLNSSTDRLSQTTTYVYDATRELQSVTDPAGDAVTYQYNLAGVMDYLKDPNLNVTTFTLDDESRVTKKTYADSTFTQTAYESGSSRVYTFTDALSQVTAYTYFADNLLYETNYTNAPTVYDFYDPAYPRLVKMYDLFSKSSNPSTWTYYPVPGAGQQQLGANQLETTIRPVANGTGSDTVAYTYDALDRAVGMAINGLATQSVGYDALGRMTSNSNALDSFTYGYKPTDGTARITSVTSTSGPALAMTYYNTPQDELVHKITATTNSGAQTLASFTYSYDSDDRVDTLSRSAPTQQTFTYGYDPANRLTSATIGTGSPQYVYKPDSASNLLTITIPGSSQTYTYSNVNTINPTTNYDANGSPIGSFGYSWDGANRLFTTTNSPPGSTSTFHYDGLGRLVEVIERSAGAVTADHAYLWCGNTLCLAHDNTQSGSPVSAQYFPQGAIIAGTPYYYIADRLGSVTALVSASGAIATQYTYDPYGNQTTVGGTVHSDLGYAGYFAHAASGLDLALNRAFDPVHGRWLNRDPIGESGGVNLYAYVGGNPTTLTDPLGWCDSSNSSGGDLPDHDPDAWLLNFLGWLGRQTALLDAINAMDGAMNLGVGTGTAAAGAEISAAENAAVEQSTYTLTNTVENSALNPNTGELVRPFVNSPLTIQEIISTGLGVPDPGGIPGALRFDAPGTFNKSTGMWELVIDPATDIVYHFNFTK